MISLRPGSHLFRLLQLLSVAGEYPAASLPLLGSARSLTELIRKLESKQMVKLADGSVVGPMRIFQVSGKLPNRTVRLYVDALPLLDVLHTGARAYYLGAFFDHHFPGNIQFVLRNHRVAEVVAAFMMAGIEFRPYQLPPLQNAEIQTAIPDWPRFYPARSVKHLAGDEYNKTMYSRMVGAVFYPGGHYTVYNTRSAVMRWKGLGEIKAAVSLDETARWNNGEQPGTVGAYSALLFGKDQAIALETLREAAKGTKSHHFNSIYNHIHYIPLNSCGVRLLNILTTPDWNELIIDSLFPPGMRITGVSNFDAQRGGTFYISLLDSDIAKLIRIRQSVTNETIEVLCFPWQAEFVRDFLGAETKIRTVEPEWMEVRLGLK